MAAATGAAALEPTLQNILERDTLKWIFVGGKGGVGKTTCSSSLAIRLSEVRDKVLILSTDPAHNLSDAFKQKFSGEPRQVDGHRNLYAMEIDPTPVLEKDKLEELLARDGAAGGGLSSLIGGDFMKSFPDLNEIISLAQVFKKLRNMDFSVVVFDTAPTGHTLRLLAMPPDVERGLGNLMSLKDNLGGLLGPLSSMMGMPQLNTDSIGSRLSSILLALQELNADLKDPERTTFVCVCIAEMLSLYETERLVQDLTKNDIDTDNIIVNQLVFPLEGTPRPDGCKLCTARQQIQGRYLGQISEMYSDFHVTKLPLMPQEVRGLADLTEFSNKLIRPVAATTCPEERVHGVAGASAGAVPPLESNVDDLDPSVANIVEQSTLQWIFVSGKGGVGKTTCSSALAVQLSKVRERVLLLSTDPAHNIADAFGQKFDNLPELVHGYGNLYAMELDITPLEEVQEEMFAQEDGADGMFGGLNNVVSDFMTSFPGITEALALANVLKMVQEMEFSAVVFDTAPTGHTLRLLSIPLEMEKVLSKLSGMQGMLTNVMSSFAPMLGVDGLSADSISSNFATLLPAIKDINQQFQDPRKTTFVCVCISEFLSLYETERLVQDLAKYKIDVRNIIINQLLFPLYGPMDCGLCLSRRAIQRKYLDQIMDLYEEFHIVKMPLLPREIKGAEELAAFSERLVAPYDPSQPAS